MKIKLLIIILVLLPLNLSAQDVLELGSGFNQTGTVEACEGIVLKPGFKFTAASGKTLSLKLNERACSYYVDDEISYANNKNYIVTVTPTSATESVQISGNGIHVSGGASYQAAVQYFDGLGRPDKLIQEGITPQGNNLVYLTEYDSFGREYKQSLPLTNGHRYDDSRTYTETKYEASPLNRVLEQQGVGDAWAGHPVKTEYGCNTSGDNVKHFYIDSNDRLASKHFYDPGLLHKTKTIDEDGKAVTEFTNKQGQLVLMRQGTDVDTYYVYDDFGNQRYILPPLAGLASNSTFTDDNAQLKNYAYVYKYDHRNRNIKKRLPGCDWIYMIYDKADRLILSQDGNQREKIDSRDRRKWTLYKYDKLGRQLYLSEIFLENTHEHWIGFFKDKVVTESFSVAGPTYPVEDTGYSKNWYHVAPMNLLSVNYYDSYDFLQLPAYADKDQLEYEEKTGYDTRYNNAKGMLTGARTYLLDGSNTYLTTVYYYDYRGQVVQARSTNHIGGYDILYNEYDFTGNVLKAYSEHSTNASHTHPLTELYKYTYDHAGRLIDTKYTLNDEPEVFLTHNEYDELGRLKTKKQHDQINTVQYEYNIRNWPTLIKDNEFEQRLYYNDDPLTTKYYNGNISSMYWTYRGQGNKYRFNYDNMNRLTESKLTMLEGGTYCLDCFYEKMAYDKHGNITELRRTTKYLYTIDSLKLFYNGNQLDRVNNYGYKDDISGYDKRYMDYHNSEVSYIQEFLYDKNGNMITDLDRRIALTKYNLLNLPDTIQFTNGNQIINTYDASGRKLKAEYLTSVYGVNVPVSSTRPLQDNQVKYYSATLYNGNIEYEADRNNNLALNRIHNTEGYVDSIVNNRGKYNYFRKDHLGSNREVWRVSGATAQTIQRTQYYPSGLPWLEESKRGEISSSQPYRFVGKEFIEDHGWDEIDHQARSMYPAIMQFTTMDPLAEKYPWVSSYAYCLNNPMKYIDPDGRDVALRFYGEGTHQQFMSIVNNALEGQFEVYFAKGPEGYALMGIRAIEGAGDISKMTENGQAFLSEMTAMINNRDVTAKMSIVYGSNEVTVGNYAQNKIDIADIAQFNITGPDIKESIGATQAGKLIHEFVEQFNKAEQGIPSGSSANYTINHNRAVSAENRVNGNTRLNEKATGRNTISVRYEEKNGSVTVVSYNISKGIIKVFQPKPYGLRR